MQRGTEDSKENMMSLHRLVFVTLALFLTGQTFGQDSSGQDSSGQDASEATRSVPIGDALGLQFQIDPVELQVCEELDEAKDHYNRTEWKPAVEKLNSFLTENPEHKRAKDALFLRGEANVQLQQYEAARKDFEQLLLLSPNESQSAHARFRLAELTMLLGNQKQARHLLNQFRQFHPSHELNAYVLPYLAEIVAREGNFDWAGSLYQELLRKYPDGPLNDESQLRSAILDYHKRAYISASEKLFQLVESKETDKVEYWTATYWLAMCELRTNRERQAANRFETLIEAQPKHQLAAASTYRAAEALRKLGKKGQAIDYFRDVRVNWPNSKYSLQALLAETELAKELEQFDRAMELAETLENLEIAQADDAEKPQAKIQIQRLMAEVLLAQEKFEEAIAKVKPLAEERRSLVQPIERENYYRDLFLWGLAERGLKNYSRGSHLLSRIRVDLLDQEFAERVMLARAETYNAAKEYTQAIEEGFRYEGRYRRGELIGPIRSQMILGMIGSDRADEAMIKFKQLLGTETSPRAEAKEIASSARYLGEYLYDHKDYDNARLVFTVLESVHETDDDLARAVSGLAWIEQKVGNQAAAAEKFDEFIARFPEHESITEVRMARAQTLSKTGDQKDAIKALEFFPDLPKDHPMRPKGMYQLAEMLHRDETMLPRAEELTQRLLEEHKIFEQRDSALYLLGIIRRLRGDETSKEAFTELVEKHPSSRYWSDALYRLAEQARSVDEEESDQEAKRFLTRLISAERDPQVLPHAIYMKGRIESDEKNWSEARETLRQLIRDYPNSDLIPVARYGVAESFYQEKNPARALQLFNILDSEKEFETDEAWGAMVQLRRAELLADNKAYVDAIKVAETIEERFPGFSLQTEVDYLLGRSYMSRGEFTKARQYYAKVGEADSSRTTEVAAMAQWMTGESYFHQKDYILAIKAYEALVADTTFPKWQAASNLQIGKCYELSENFDQAQKFYQRVIERFEDSEMVGEAKIRLKIVEQKRSQEAN